MISMFGTGDFIRVSIKEDWYGLGRVGLLMGFALLPSREESGTYRLVGLVTGQDGDIGLVAADDMVSDHRYDVAKDRFIDQSAVDRLAEDPFDPMVEEPPPSTIE